MLKNFKTMKKNLDGIRIGKLILLVKIRNIFRKLEN